MKLEDQVVSLELAIKLKEAGIKQESYFVWQECYHITNDTTLVKTGGRWVTKNPTGMMRPAIVRPYDQELGQLERDAYSAFTACEMVEVLPAGNIIKRRKDDPYYGVDVGTEISILPDEPRYAVHLAGTMEYVKAPTLADAMAKMLIHLKKKKLI